MSGTREDLPDVIVTRAEGMALFTRAVELQDWERAGVWADLLLGENDRQEEDA